MPAAIEAVDLRKRYPPAVQALDGVSLSVESGTIFGVLGPNGAGKSTLTRVLCTLTQPDSGSAVVAGIDVTADPVRVRRTIWLSERTVEECKPSQSAVVISPKNGTSRPVWQSSSTNVSQTASCQN